MGRYTPPPPTLRSLSTGPGKGQLYQGTALNLTAADTGKNYTLMADSDAQVVITLPTLTADMNGTEYLFYIAETSTGGYQFNCGVDTDAFKGYLVLGTASGAQDANGLFRACGSSMDRISIKSGETNGGGGEGSMLRMTAVVGSLGIWGVEGCILTADVDSDGSALFVNTS